MTRRAFTLVELLVAAAVTALLASLVLAVVQRVREEADSAQCMANLKQLAAANLTYAAENGGQYVPAQDKANLTRWHGVRRDAAAPFDATQGPLAPYLGREARVKLCPGLRRFRKSGATFEEGTGGYGYNAAYLGGMPGNPFTAERLANVEHAPRTVMFADSAFARAEGVQEYAYAEPWVSESPRGRFTDALSASVHFRHGGRANVAWADGHVTAEPPARLDGANAYGGSGAKWQLGWFGPEGQNGYWRPY